MRKELKCHVGIGPEVRGVALVADDNFSARYDLDRINGVFSRPQHKLYGKSYKDVILVLNTAKGGVATAWMLYEMASREIAPKAILFNNANNSPIIQLATFFGFRFLFFAIILSKNSALFLSETRIAAS